jgi:predicted MPP superfamily phosphohydrolase
MTASSLKDLLESLRVEQITGTNGPDYSLSGPAHGGQSFNFTAWSGASKLSI